MRKVLLIIILLGLVGVVKSQEIPKVSDSVTRVDRNIEYLYQWLWEQSEDRIAEQGEEPSEPPNEELLEDFLYYRENPVNLNSDEVSHLEEIGLLTPFQTQALRQYRRQFGDFLFLEELLMLDFTETELTVIAPLVFLGKSKMEQAKEMPKAHQLFNKGKHQVSAHYDEKFGTSGNEDHLGSPRKIQLKYTYHYKQKLRWGIAMEKDAGEPFFLNTLSDSVQALARQYRRSGFDFYGFHAACSDIKLTRNASLGAQGLKVKDLVLGDYLLTFGQGLTLWTGASFAKGMGGSSTMRRAAGVKPKASCGEGKFFRGAATTFQHNAFFLTAFYSIRNIDATASQADSLNESETVSALQENGYHRTLNELAKRNNILQQVMGGHVCYAGANLEVGYTIYHLRLNTPLELKPSKYNQFYFQGDRLTAMGLDFRWLNGNSVFFGEFSRSDNGGLAGLVGLTVKPKGYIDFSLLYRHYDKHYQSLFNASFGESSRGQGEEGVYWGVHCAPAARWDLLASCDFFRLTWLTSQAYTPSWGQEYNLKLNHQISNTANIQFRFTSKTKMKNSTDDHAYSHYPISYTKRNIRLQVSYSITETLSCSDKAAYSHYFNDEGTDSRGMMLCHDIAFKPPEKTYSLIFRYALFDCDDYNSRISLYENDVPGAFSIPSQNGLGTRIYLLYKQMIFSELTIYSKIGFTLLPDEKKTDLKIEVIWKK